MPSLQSRHQHCRAHEDHFCAQCIHSHIPGSRHTSSVHHLSLKRDRILFGKIQFEWEVIQREGRETGEKNTGGINERGSSRCEARVQEKENTGIERRKVKWLIMEMEGRRKDGRGVMGTNTKLWVGKKVKRKKENTEVKKGKGFLEGK